MFDPKSDYALNKLDKEAIVCPSTTGIHIRLTCKDFASEAEFQKWKIWSDKNYHQAELTEHVYTVNTLSMTGLSEAATATASAESELICRQEQQEREQLRQVLLAGLDVCLTEKQHLDNRTHDITGKNSPKKTPPGRTSQEVMKRLVPAINVFWSPMWQSGAAARNNDTSSRPPKD